MTSEDKAWLLAVAYTTKAPKDTSPNEFLSEVERSEADFLSLLQQKDAEATNESIKIWEKLGS
ncbi:hypothetical protein V5379_003728 [Citrobacter freundii]|nr:hypothetical protein [Citrobacter freundii]